MEMVATWRTWSRCSNTMAQTVATYDERERRREQAQGARRPADTPHQKRARAVRARPDETQTRAVPHQATPCAVRLRPIHQTGRRRWRPPVRPRAPTPTTAGACPTSATPAKVAAAPNRPTWVSPDTAPSHPMPESGIQAVRKQVHKIWQARRDRRARESHIRLQREAMHPHASQQQPRAPQRLN